MTRAGPQPLERRERAKPFEERLVDLRHGAFDQRIGLDVQLHARTLTNAYDASYRSCQLGVRAALDHVMANSKKTPPVSADSEKLNNEPGGEQQRQRRDRENMGGGRGSHASGVNQGREGGRGTGRNGRSEKGDSARSRRK